MALLDDLLFLHITMAAPCAMKAAAKAAEILAGAGPAAYSDSDSNDAGACSDLDKEHGRRPSEGELQARWPAREGLGRAGRHRPPNGRAAPRRG